MAGRDADGSPEQTEHDGFDQELALDVAGTSPHSHAQADLAIALPVTVTSMMFMIPIPPTINEIKATQRSRLATRPTVPLTVRTTSVKSWTAKSAGIPGAVR